MGETRTPAITAAELVQELDAANGGAVEQREERSADAQTDQIASEGAAKAVAVADAGKGIEPEAAAAKEAFKEAQRFQLKYRGKPIEVDEEEIVQLAQKGFSYDKEMAKIKEMEARLNSDAQNVAEYREFQGWMKAHPGAADMVQRVLQHVETTGKVPSVNFQEAAGDAAPDMGGPLAERIAKLESALFSREIENQQGLLANRVVDAIKSNPTLAAVSAMSMAQFGHDIALDKLLEAVQVDPEADITLLAKSVATRFKVNPQTVASRGSAADEYVASKNRDKERFSHEKPNQTVSAPDSGTAARFSAKDLKSGAIGRSVIADLMKG